MLPFAVSELVVLVLLVLLRILFYVLSLILFCVLILVLLHVVIVLVLILIVHVTHILSTTLILPEKDGLYSFFYKNGDAADYFYHLICLGC